MSVNSLEEHTYQPAPVDQVDQLLSFMDAHEAKRGERPEPRYLLVGPDEHEYEEIPAEAYAVLRQVIEAMKAGKAVTVTPNDMLLTTQQAADYLGVSRPTVVKLIGKGELPAETPGQRRRLVRFDHLVAYRARRREAQYRALFETSADFDDDPAALAEELRKAREDVARERARDR